MSWDSASDPSHWYILFKVLKLEAALDHDHHNLKMLQVFNIPVPVNMIPSLRKKYGEKKGEKERLGGEREIYGSFQNIVGLNSKCSDSKSTEREKGGGERDKLEERKRERYIYIYIYIYREREREKERERDLEVFLKLWV